MAITPTDSATPGSRYGEPRFAPKRAGKDACSARDSRPPKPVGRGGLPDALVRRMYRDYLRLKSVAKVGALYGGRSRQSVWELFNSRNLPLESKRYKTKVVFDGVAFTLHGGRGDRYLTSTTGGRRLLHHLVWEKHHGSIPPGHNICFRDGNRLNCTPGNLVCRTIADATRDQGTRRVKILPGEGSGPTPVAVEMILALHAEYAAGASLRASARKCHRSGAWLAGAFRRFGLSVRDNPRRHSSAPPDRALGRRQGSAVQQFLGLADSLKRLQIPRELKNEWRFWPLALRGRFIARARRRLRSPNDRPKRPFSANVEAFDYGCAAAHRIAAETLSGRASHRLKITSQGVIWNRQLWFWNPQNRSYALKGGRHRSLHHAIWEAAAGRPVPKGFCVCLVDDNPNNLLPENFSLRSTAELLPEGHGRAVFQRSRKITGLLLNRSQSRHGSGARRDQLDHLLARR